MAGNCFLVISWNEPLTIQKSIGLVLGFVGVIVISLAAVS